MATRGRYRTRQRELVVACLSNNAGRYLTVDDTRAIVKEQGEAIGRSTVYRALETLVADGRALKVTAPSGEASYRMVAQEGSAGQLMCLSCGQAYPLDCHMIEEFTAHVRDHHGFKVDPARTVLYGLCRDCAKDAR